MLSLVSLQPAHGKAFTFLHIQTSFELSAVIYYFSVTLYFPQQRPGKMCSAAFSPSFVWFGIVPKTLNIVKYNFLRLPLRRIAFKIISNRRNHSQMFHCIWLEFSERRKIYFKHKDGKSAIVKCTSFLLGEGVEKCWGFKCLVLMSFDSNAAALANVADFYDTRVIGLWLCFCSIIRGDF